MIPSPPLANNRLTLALALTYWEQFLSYHEGKNKTYLESRSLDFKFFQNMRPLFKRRTYEWRRFSTTDPLFSSRKLPFFTNVAYAYTHVIYAKDRERNTGWAGVKNIVPLLTTTSNQKRFYLDHPINDRNGFGSPESHRSDSSFLLLSL